MADNTNESLGSSIPIQAEHPSKEITPAKDTQSITPTQETETMEVHKHPQHVMHKKKWNEYLLEFFMLFLAVFLGFVAENIRDKISDREKEKVYISSLVEDLKTDTTTFNRNIRGNNLLINGEDSVLNFLSSDLHSKIQQNWQ